MKCHPTWQRFGTEYNVRDNAHKSQFCHWCVCLLYDCRGMYDRDSWQHSHMMQHRQQSQTSSASSSSSKKKVCTLLQQRHLGTWAPSFMTLLQCSGKGCWRKRCERCMARRPLNCVANRLRFWFACNVAA